MYQLVRENSIQRPFIFLWKSKIGQITMIKKEAKPPLADFNGNGVCITLTLIE